MQAARTFPFTSDLGSLAALLIGIGAGSILAVTGF